MANSRPVAKWHAEGRCTNCGGERSTRDKQLRFRWCHECRVWRRQRRGRERAVSVIRGWCRRCRHRRALNGLKRCAKCREYRKTHGKSHYRDPRFVPADHFTLEQRLFRVPPGELGELVKLVWPNHFPRYGYSRRRKEEKPEVPDRKLLLTRMQVTKLLHHGPAQRGPRVEIDRHYGALILLGAMRGLGMPQPFEFESDEFCESELARAWDVDEEALRRALEFWAQPPDPAVEVEFIQPYRVRVRLLSEGVPTRG